jgi:tetratricopeptide (TPR) repeat protein
MSLLKPALLLSTCLLSQTALADQDDPRLEALFKQLRETSNAVQAAPLEASIWEIWMEHGDSTAYNAMIRGIQQINSNNLPAALQTFTQLIEQYPDYAEAWNKRATIHYLMQNFEASEADISRTLQLEPFHFGALSGQGLVKMGQRKYLEARNAFNDALEVNPGMDSVRSNLQALDEYLKKGAI